jgi:cobalt-zinc-cadmium efflux system outer membrane protein
MCGAAIASLALATTPAAADEPRRTLTLDDAVALALARNPDSESADADVDAAEGAVTQSRAFSNPSLFVSSLGRNLSPFDAPIPNQIGVTWTVPIGGKRAAGIAVARADLDGAKATRTTARRQLAFDVQTAFVTVLLDAAQLDFAREDQAGLQQAQELDEVRYKDGKIAYGDVLKLRIQARTADDTVHQDELTLASDRAELARLVGDGVLADDFEVTGTLAAPTVSEELTADQLYERALAHRTDYLALQASERSASAAVTAARRQPIPDLDILFDYNQVPDEAGSFDLSLSVTLPLFDRNRGATRQAQASRRKATLASASLAAQIRADATRAVDAWATSRARLALYDEELLADDAESLDITRHAYERGRGTLLDFLDAESSYREVQRAYRAAVADAILAAAQLRFVAGEDLP